MTCALPALLLLPAMTKAPEQGREIAFSSWSGDELAAGRHRGTSLSDSAIVISTPTGTRGGYELASWTSPWTATGFGFTQLIASWAAKTPGDSWVEVQVRSRTAAGTRSSWDTMARWASGDKHLRRTTVSGQTDDLGRVNVDTWLAAGAEGLTSWQVRVNLLRKPGQKGPKLTMAGAVASRLPSGPPVGVSTPGPGVGVTLAVPPYSQMLHSGHYPQWGGGGESWCSPTSTAMVLSYFHKLPSAGAWKFVPAGHPDPWVDLIARKTYDYDYDGTGNWPFNTAYAAGRTGISFVTRLRSLTEAESFIAAGIPLIASVSYGRNELTGAAVATTPGHLLVIVGFTADGDVVVNDPAAHTNETVRRTYDRAEFERAWLTKSGGVVYVVTDAAHPLPAAPAQANW